METLMANRPTSFQLHIRPLFTANDIAHMKPRGWDLSSYDFVKSKSKEILDRLKDSADPMPPTTDGGPWPDEWIALFERWRTERHPA
jgi:hypothetical protein